MNADKATVAKLLEQVKSLERNAAAANQESPKKIRYLDDKALWG